MKNEKGTQILGPCENGSSLILEFEHKIYVPYDEIEHRINNTRRITSFAILKEIDTLTPKLYEIMCNDKRCNEVLIKLFKVSDETGSEKEYFNYLLQNAKIISVKNSSPSANQFHNKKDIFIEEVRFLAEKFTWKHIEGDIKYTEKANK